jgi:two-component system cell cycle sensor histidine kinase/response regulator CckA
MDRVGVEPASPSPPDDARFKAIFEEAAIGIALVDMEGRPVASNPALRRMLGYSEDELSRMPFTDFTHPDDVAADWDLFSELVEGRRDSYRMEKRYFRKDGSLLWGRLTASLVRCTAGEPAYAVGMVEDISESKRVEEALGASERRYRALLEQASDAISVADENGNLVEVNPRMCELLGYHEEELLALNVDDLVVAEEGGEPLLSFSELRGGHTFMLERRMRRRDGTLVAVEVGVKMVADGRVLAIVRDVSERKQAEAALRTSEQRYRSLVQTAGGVILCLSPDCRILEFNREAERLHGRSRDELLGESYLELLPAQLRELFADEIRKVLGGAARRGVETVVPAQDGSDRVLLWNLSPLPCGEDLASGVLAIGWDITPRKQAEQALRASEDQRRQSERLEAVGQLAGGIAHDFNNLLLALRGFGELALDQLDRGRHDVRAEIEGMLTAAERAASLTGQLLAYSRRQVLNPEIVDLNAIVADTEKLLRRLIGEDIHIVSSHGPELGSVRADRGQLSQVLLNLALNARDAMPEGGRLTIETARADFDKPTATAGVVIPAGPYLRLTVTDTGSGITPELLPHVFEPFFTTKEPGRGTGLGLSTVYGIVKQSNGYITVDSAPGRGAAFTVYLPRVDKPADPVAPAAANPTPAGGSETILIVEDEPAVREVLRRLLEQQGYNVLTTSNGSEALALHAQHAGTIDLILTDVVMPGMSGFELAQQLTQTGKQPKVLYVSGYSEEAILRHGSLERGAAFLAKTFTTETLKRTVRDLLDSTPQSV